jgi:hypothetical protein
VTLRVDTPDEAERIYNGLSDGGTIRMPLDKTFFAQKFGMFADKFGIPWWSSAKTRSNGRSGHSAGSALALPALPALSRSTKLTRTADPPSIAAIRAFAAPSISGRPELIYSCGCPRVA